MSLCRIAPLALAACNGAVTLAIDGDRPVPRAIDAICVGVADPGAHGRQFGKLYRLEGALGKLPQTLRVEPGGARAAWSWVRGDRGGVAVARAAGAIDFTRDVRLALDRCTLGRSVAPAQRGDRVGPAGALLAASAGPTGSVVVAVAPGSAAVISVKNGAAVATPAPAPPPGKPVAVIAADLDGDCADDLIVATDGAPPEWWRRDGGTFVDVGAIGTAPVAALAAADVDRDGNIDVVLGGGGKLELWRNDGSGQLTVAPTAALTGGGRVTAVSALALGDVDGDGNPDLIVGQAGGPLAAWLGSDGGMFLPSTAIVPPIPLDVTRLVIADAAGDFAADLAVVVRDAPMRLYLDRDGRLEDRSFVWLPQPAPVARAIAIANWDDGCEPDAVIASDTASPLLRGQPGGALVADGAAPAATDVVMVDLDDDGTLDAVLAGPQGVAWLAR